MNETQLQKIKRWTRISSYNKDLNHQYNTFMTDLSKYLLENLDRDLIINIQKNMIEGFKSNLDSFSAVYEAGVASDYNSISLVDNSVALVEEKYGDCVKKRIIESHILFYSGNNLIDIDIESNIDKSIFQILKLVNRKNSISKGYVDPYYPIINMLKYSYDIDKKFSDAIIIFLKEYDVSNLLIKDNLTIIYHMMLRYSGVKVDYLKTIQTAPYSEDNFYYQLGDLFSQDYKYYLHRYNSLKRKSGYMNKRKKILISSINNEIYNEELASLAGRLSSSEQYDFCHYITRNQRSPEEKSKFSKYASKIILSSNNKDCHYRLLKSISDEDLAFCLPVLVQSLEEHYYGKQDLENRMNEIAKGKK